MSDKNFDLPQINQALADLSEVIIELNNAVAAKKAEIKNSAKATENQLKEKDAKLNILRESSQNVLDNIGTIITKLDKVLENNGSSNNNN